MRRLNDVSKAVLVLCLLSDSLPANAQKHERQHQRQKVKKSNHDLPPVIWRDPGNISVLDLLHGAGGTKDAPDPHVSYSFVKEDKEGSNPKFDVKDSNGVEWRVKLGSETKSETAATRLLWAAGYFVDEDYYLPELRVEGLPKLRRGRKFVTEDGLARGVRLERRDHEAKKIANWDWFTNPFAGTKELNGLRVMMALINNWDLKEINNAIYVVNREQHYALSDLGATFGKTGNVITRSKSNVKGYKNSKFIEKVTATEVDFEMHTRPLFLTIVAVSKYKRRTKMEKIAKHIPRSDVKWIAHLLSQLSHEQIEDCFRSAGYIAEEVDGYASEVERRIAELNTL
jgi:hypothetical protein